MSYIRASEGPTWEDNAFDNGLYVYSGDRQIHYLPSRHREFTEVVMRMLDQSGELDEETLTDVHTALRNRLRIEAGTSGRIDE
jgi:hypothetical protein